jgi:hypothetical protein
MAVCKASFYSFMGVFLKENYWPQTITRKQNCMHVGVSRLFAGAVLVGRQLEGLVW